jgi:predicted double-glycine peptidase
MRCLHAIAIALLVAGCALESPVPDRPVSYLALRFESTIPQRMDFTCGAASLATVLTFYWNSPTSEEAALAPLKGRYTDEQIRKLGEIGLSFDDLIYMASKLGFSAEGAKVPIEQLAELSGPVIVHLDKGTFKHFVVLRRIGDGVYYVSDPVVGQLAMHADEFKEQYTGNALAIWKTGADLPRNAKLERPRDGIDVDGTLRRNINIPNRPFHPHL